MIVMDNSIKKINIEKKILLIFLGGTTYENNLIQHWKNMNTTFLTKNNYYIVIHPMILENYTINEEFKNIFNQDNIFIVNKNHHLKTAWSTRSLSDATLLTIQYAHTKLNEGELYDKYILLSSSCCPLYNFDEIYKVLDLNNKSWLYGSPVEENNVTIENTYLGSKENKSSLVFSQWMILDKIHIKYFFSDNNYISVYKKDKNIKTCLFNFINKTIEIESIKIIDEKLNHLNIFLNKFNICNGSDERFFGNYIFNRLLIEANQNGISDNNLLDYILNNIENISLCSIKRNLKFFPKNILNNFECISNNNLLSITYIPPTPVLKNNKYFSLNDNENYINNINVFFYDIMLNNLNFNPINPILLNMSTWCDWSCFSVDPRNVLRNFNIVELDINNFLNSEEYLTSTNSKLYNLFEEQECDDYFLERINLKDILFPLTSHPVEYSCWTFLNIINTFYILLYFNCSFYTSESRYTVLTRAELASNFVFLLYKKIIFNELNITIESEKKKDIYLQIEEKIKQNPSIIYKKFGTPVTYSTIMSSISIGSLFIRKCYDSSLIETYTNELKQIKYNYFSQSSIINNKVMESKDIITKFNLSKYKKYSIKNNFIHLN